MGKISTVNVLTRLPPMPAHSKKIKAAAWAIGISVKLQTIADKPVVNNKPTEIERNREFNMKYSYFFGK